MDIEHIVGLFHYMRDGNRVKDVTAELEAFAKNPQAAITCLQIFVQYSTDEKIQKSALIFLVKSIKYNFNQFDNNSKTQFLDLIVPLINPSLSTQFYPDFTEICAIYLDQDFTIYPIFYEKFPKPFTLIILSKTIVGLSEEIIKTNQSFFELSYIGLQDNNFLKESVDIVSILLKNIPDPSPFGPFINFVTETYSKTSSFSDKAFNAFWQLAALLYELSYLPGEILQPFLVYFSSLCTCENSQVERVYSAIQLFSDCIYNPKSPISQAPSLLTLFLESSAEICAIWIVQNDSIPDKSFDIFLPALEELSASQLIIDICFRFLGFVSSINPENPQSSEVAHVSFGLILLGLLIRSAADKIFDSEKVNFIAEILVNSVNQNSPYLIRIAALGVITGFRDVFTELETIFPKLLAAILPLVASPKNEERSAAYSSLINLIMLSHEAPPHFLTTVLNLQKENQIAPEQQPDYIKLLSQIVQISDEIDDDTLDQLIQIAETCLSLTSPEGENSDISSIRISALLLAANLIRTQDSLLEDFWRLCQEPLRMALSDSSNDSFSCGTDFIKYLAASLKTEVTPIFKPFAEQFAQELKRGTPDDDMEEDQFETLIGRQSNVLETVAILIGSCNIYELIPPYIAVTSIYLSSDEISMNIDGCDSIQRVSKALAPNPTFSEELNQANCLRVKQLTGLIISLILEANDIGLMESALDAIRKVFKHGFAHAPEELLAKNMELLQKIFAGEIVFLGGKALKECEKVSNILQSLMDYVGIVFQKGPQVTSLAEYLFGWLKEVKEYDFYPILGALIDAIEFCEIPDLASQVCAFLISIAPQIAIPDIELNFCYCMSVILQKYPSQLGLVQSLTPIFQQWYQVAKSKDSGYEELISNIGQVFLSLGALNPETPAEIIFEGLKTFPPDDQLDTENECQLILKLLERPQPNEIQLQAALGITRLLTASKSDLIKRKVPQEILSQMQGLLKQMASNPDFYAQMMAALKNRLKKQALTNLLKK